MSLPPRRRTILAVAAGSMLVDRFVAQRVHAIGLSWANHRKISTNIEYSPQLPQVAQKVAVAVQPSRRIRPS